MAARAGPTPFTYMREVERSIAEVYEPSVQGGGSGGAKQGSMRFTAEPQRTQRKRGEDKRLHTAGLRTASHSRRSRRRGRLWGERTLPTFGGSDYRRDRTGVLERLGSLTVAARILAASSRVTFLRTWRTLWRSAASKAAL